MCIICASKSGVRQPTERELFTMFQNNPHGAGYMTARHGMVTISKGYMDFDEFLNAVRKEHFTAQDSVVYHFRISTQAGINPEMTHPFPLSNRLGRMMKDRASGSGVFARDPDAQLDVIELQLDGDAKYEAEARGRTAWRLESSLREFQNIIPVDFWFDYPLHTLERSADLGSMAAGSLRTLSRADHLMVRAL